MNIYYVIYLIIQIFGLGIILAKDGEPREDEYNFKISLIASLISIALTYMAVKTGF